MKKWVYLMCVMGVLTMPFLSASSAQWFLFQNPMLGKTAEDFQLPSVSGESRQFSRIRGQQPAILFFWATWCPHCRTSLEMLNQKRQEIQDQGIRVVLLDLGEDPREVREYLDRGEIQYDSLIDGAGEVAQQYGVQGIPTFVYISSEGTVKNVGHQFLEDYGGIGE